MRCAICGSDQFRFGACLWPELITTWQLAPHEVAYIDRQQGGRCTQCGCNLRSIVLGQAIRDVLGVTDCLRDAVKSPHLAGLSLLEINEAGDLSPVLRQLPGHRLIAYPDVDIHAMPFADATFDMIVHSDTLEHVEAPLSALAECRRILKPNGALCYTVPMIVERMTRDRHGLAPSYHGNKATNQGDYLVRTEFGADAWTFPLRAGFTRAAMTCFDWPAALAITARP